MSKTRMPAPYAEDGRVVLTVPGHQRGVNVFDSLLEVALVDAAEESKRTLADRVARVLGTVVMAVAS